jgi:hypothetical protein
MTDDWYGGFLWGAIVAGLLDGLVRWLVERRR